eukprot:1120939-Rhodomonas_salina.1
MTRWGPLRWSLLWRTSELLPCVLVEWQRVLSSTRMMPLGAERWRVTSWWFCGDEDWVGSTVEVDDNDVLSTGVVVVEEEEVVCSGVVGVEEEVRAKVVKVEVEVEVEVKVEEVEVE